MKMSFSKITAVCILFSLIQVETSNGSMVLLANGTRVPRRGFWLNLPNLGSSTTCRSCFDDTCCRHTCPNVGYVCLSEGGRPGGCLEQASPNGASVQGVKCIEPECVGCTQLSCAAITRVCNRATDIVCAYNL